MPFDKDLLFMSAARLYSMGMELDAAREELRKLVDDGVSYDSPKMLTAYNYFKELDKEWKILEAEHIKLRDKIEKRII